MRVTSPLLALRAVNLLSSLFKAMLQRPLYSQNYVVIFSFPVCFSEALIITWTRWEGSNRCCDAMVTFVQIACLRDFKRIHPVWANKRLLYHFPGGANSVFQVSSVILLRHSALLPLCPMWDSRDIWWELRPFCERTSNGREKGIFRAVIHLLSSARTTNVVQVAVTAFFSSHYFLCDGMVIISWGWNCGFVICWMGCLFFLKSHNNMGVHSLFLWYETARGEW